MSLASRGSAQRGFTLIEATISLTLLLIVMALSLTFLFGMQAFARRQELFAEPRQTARRAVDYLSEIARSATDMNNRRGNPNAIVTWYRLGHAQVPTQATYNNVTDATLADAGTDIVTLGRAINNRRIQFNDWNGPGDLAGASSATIIFRDGCDDQVLNMKMFMDATGCQGDPCCNTGNYPCPGANSAVLLAIDEQGNWAYFQITSYSAYLDPCPNAIIHINISPGGSDGINPPSYRGVTVPCSIAGGLQYFAFRVRDNQLEQKNGMFNPTTDNPGAAFTPLLEDVEDLQIAWVYNDGTVWNDSPANQLPTTNQVPSQDGLGGAIRDIIDVRAMRISITARAPREIPNQLTARFFRPASEDRVAEPVRDRRYHYRLTSTVMIRNRMLGS